jgi:hypothetical protein
MFGAPSNITISAAATHADTIIETLIKVSGWIIAVGTAVAGVWKYVDQKADAHAKDSLARQDALAHQLVEEQRSDETRRLELRKPFTVKQQEIYFDLLNTTAILGNRYMNEPEWREAALHFWVLFWGAVPVVADEGVALALDRFSETLDRPEDNDGIPVRNASMELARACRTSLGEAWSSKFELSTRTSQTKGAITPDAASAN